MSHYYEYYYGALKLAALCFENLLNGTIPPPPPPKIHYFRSAYRHFGKARLQM